MSVTRRQFIHNGLGFISLGVAMPTFLMQAAQAMAADAPANSAAGIPGGKILVVIEMQGGNDGVNTVIPFTDAKYAQLRPTIGIPASDVIKIGSNVGLHPNMTAMGKLFESGKVAVMTGVGYPNPNRSHFQSMDIWQTGNPETETHDRTGWIARYFDADGHFQGNPLSGITLGSTLPLALWTTASPVSVIGNGRDYGFYNLAGDRNSQITAIRALYAQGTVASGTAEFIRNVGSNVYTSTEQIKKAIGDYDVKAGARAVYPPNNGLGYELQMISKLITGGIGTRVYYATLGGFDTHANQPRTQSNLLGELSEAVSAFYQDLALQGRADDVMLLTFSEFGRRVQENGSAGTDHGAASVMFAVGGGVRGGVYGDYPSLSDLEDGDLRFHTDFRSVYATVLDGWLKCKSNPVLGGDFAPLKFV